MPEPGNPQALNRYAYVYNNPLKYTDPTGHSPCKGHGKCGGGGGGSPAQPSMPNTRKSTASSSGNKNRTIGSVLSSQSTRNPSSTNAGRAPVELNPFAYDTMGVRLGGLAKFIAGPEIGLAFYWNQRALRDAWDQRNASLLSDFDFSVNLEFNLSAGFSAEYSAVGSIIGADGSVLDQSQVEGINPNSMPVNVLVCPTRANGFCVGGSATLDLQQGKTKAIEYVPFLAYGRGIDISVDLGQSSSWIAYAHPATGFQGPRIPFLPVR